MFLNVLAYRLRQIEEEQLRRARHPLACYNKELIHAKQMEFHTSQARIRFVFGGNRTGKTECGAVETVWLALGIHPYRVNRPSVDCYVVSLSTSVQRDVAQAKILKYLDSRHVLSVTMLQGRRDEPQGGIIDYIAVRNAFGNISRIYFKSCEQGRDKFVGTSLDFVWFDEEPPRDVYEECQMRLLDKKGFLFCTMTPLLGLTYVYESIYLAPSSSDIWHITMAWCDNPYLDADEIAYYNATMSESELRCRRDGEFYADSGLVYNEFDEHTHVISNRFLPKQWYDCISIDPGLNNPLSCHWYAVDSDGVVYVMAEHYEAKKDIYYHIERIKTISKQLGWHTDSSGRLTALIDSAAMQHTLAADSSVCEIFREQGINVNPRVDKNLFAGINRVKAYLRNADGEARLYIFSSCVNLIRELKGYRWGKADERPRKADDHALDELRYYISSRPQPSKPEKRTLTAIELDKQRLAKERHRL